MSRTPLMALQLVPNFLTTARLVVGILFPFAPPEWWLGLLVFAAASDLIDGSLARWLGASGPVGTYLDPVADKAIILGVLATLLIRDLVTPGELLLIALRDVAVILGTVWLVVSGQRAVLARLRPSIPGKLTTAAQFVYLLLILGRQEPLPPTVTAAVATLSGLAGLDYLDRGRRAAGSGKALSEPEA